MRKFIALAVGALAAFVGLGAGLLSTAPEAQAARSPGRLEFQVTRNGEPFGAHTITVSEQDGALVVRNSVSLRAGLGPVTVFRYQQSCTEAWRGGALESIDCSTLKDGRRTAVRGAREGEQLRITGLGGERTFPATIAPTSWWTRTAMRGGVLLDTETGQEMRVRVTRLGRETVTVGGRPIAADRYRVEGTLAVDLWYDDQGRWVRCAFTARGQRIEYQLTSPLSAAPA